ncbi:MAG TPA: hypothetical protein PLV72_04145 [Candidatus Magasanikbacteria bacterium]|nr:hypothetical protein [Candidatus Magasanikbacteria bacterium]
MTIDQKHLAKIRKVLNDYGATRLAIMGLANDALHHAKRAIFALHRDNIVEANERITAVEDKLKEIATKYGKEDRTYDEGAYRAAIEEYVEAKIFLAFVRGEKIGEVSGFGIDSETYVAGLSDSVGEMLRFAIRAATRRDLQSVVRAATTADDVLAEIMEMNLTSYLRNKADQAKQSLLKLETILFEAKLRLE